MKTIFKDKNLKELKNFLILSDGTCVVEYTKFDDKQKYVLIDDKEFGPFEKTDLYKRIVRCLETNYDYSLLLTEDGTLLRTSSQNTEDKKRDDETTQENKGIVKKIEFQSPKMNRAL